MKKITKLTIYILPGASREAEEWAGELLAMYRAFLQGEVGVHRLVKYNSEGLRQTSFAEVVVDAEQSGEQVRSYVFDPYKLVKDLKTGKETEQVEEVLAGRLELIK